MHGDAQLAARLLDRSRTMAREMAQAAARVGVEGPNLVEAGASYAIYAGHGSPLTQAGGPFEEPGLQEVRRFYSSHRCGWEAIVTPFTPTASVNRLLSLGATVMNWESVLARPLDDLPEMPEVDGEIREVGDADLGAWSEVGIKGFFGEASNPVIQLLGRVMEEMPNQRRYLLTCQGEPAAAAVLSICHGVAFLGGAATLPAFRGKGFQSALIARRLRDASHEADLATMGAAPGSISQRNGERLGLRIAFTSLSLAVPA